MARFLDTFRSAFRAMAERDVRAFAAARILLAIYLAGDWIVRWRSFDEFYGIYQLSAHDGRAHFIVSALTASVGLRVLVFLVGLVVFAAFGVGLWARICKPLAFAIEVAAISGAPIIKEGGDLAVVSLLFWMQLLPVSARWSLDSWNRRVLPRAPESRKVALTTVPCLCLTAHLALMYFYAGLAKSGADWETGAALHYAVSSDVFARVPAAATLTVAPWMLALVARAIRHCEILSGVLLVLPWWQPLARRAGVAAMAGMHIGIAACLRLEMFSFVMLIWLTTCLDRGLLDAVESRVRRAASRVSTRD